MLIIKERSKSVKSPEFLICILPADLCESPDPERPQKGTISMCYVRNQGKCSYSTLHQSI